MTPPDVVESAGAAPRKAPANAWKPGQSGNPRGRRPGEGPNQRLRAALKGREAELVETIITAALAGDMQAARVIMDRVWPTLRAVEAPVAFELQAGASLADQGRAVFAAAAAGHLAPGQASALLQSLGALARVVEVTEIEERIARIESVTIYLPGNGREGDAV